MATNRFAGDVERRELKNTISSPAALSSLKAVRRGWLTDDGTDQLLNENYSSTSATTCYYTVTSSPMVLSAIVIIMSDNAILTAPSSDDFATLCGGTSSTNGIKLRITDGTASVLDISYTTGIVKFADLALISCGKINEVSEDAAADSHRIVATIGMQDLFGVCPVLPVGFRVEAYLSDNYSTLDFFKIGVIGYSD